jgi:hypothetical protein
MVFCLNDALDFAENRPATAKAFCLLDISVNFLAQRQMFYLRIPVPSEVEGVAKENFCVRLRPSSEQSEWAANLRYKDLNISFDHEALDG